MAKRPTTLKVLGQKYKVLYDYKNPENLGETVEDTSTIHVRGTLPEGKIARVLMHEVTHAVLNETPFSMRKRFDVEEVCDIVGYFMIHALKDNPQLVEYILSELDDEDGGEDGKPASK